MSIIKLFSIKYGLPILSGFIGIISIIITLIFIINHLRIYALIIFILTIIFEIYITFLIFKYKPSLIAYYNSKVNINITRKTDKKKD